MEHRNRTLRGNIIYNPHKGTFAWAYGLAVYKHSCETLKNSLVLFTALISLKVSEKLRLFNNSLFTHNKMPIISTRQKFAVEETSANNNN